MRMIDLPPVWLVAALVVTWFSPWLAPWGRLVWPGVVLLVAAGVLTIAALVEFQKARTTFIPRQKPSALITGGIFRWTRNPIYVADGLILAGFALIWGKILGLLLALPLLWWIERHFIRGEEARLREAFGAAFDEYARQTRRWL